MLLLIHSFSKHVLSTYYMLGIPLGARDTEVNMSDQIPPLMKRMSSGESCDILVSKARKTIAPGDNKLCEENQTR